MSSEELPPDIAAAVDRWLDSDADADLDALDQALAGASAIDGDLEARATQIRRGLSTRTRGTLPPWWPLAALAVAALLVLGLWTSSEQALLVSIEEAGAPAVEGAVRGTVTTRAVGPTLTVASPSTDTLLEGDAFTLQIEAAPGPAGVPIDPGSLAVIYLRGDGLDLLPRLAGDWKGGTFTARGVRLPPGEHPVRIVLSDLDLEMTTLEVVLTVKP